MAKPYLHCHHRFKNGKDHCYYLWKDLHNQYYPKFGVMLSMYLGYWTGRGFCTANFA